jgi:hypothetical protein
MFKRVPVRAIFKGVKQIDNKLVDFEEYHDFYEFKALVTNEELFQVI